MSDYINHKEYKLPNGRTVTADFNELGHATVTIQAMDALFDILNSSDVVEVVRCHDCKFAEVADANDSEDGYICQFHRGSIWFSGSYCSWGERAEA